MCSVFLANFASFLLIIRLGLILYTSTLTTISIEKEKSTRNTNSIQ